MIDYVTPGEAATILGCTRQTINNMMRDGRLPAVTLHNGDAVSMRIIRRKDVQRCMGVLAKGRAALRGRPSSPLALIIGALALAAMMAGHIAESANDSATLAHVRYDTVVR